ncbi:MAG: tRNA pseudouridine(38-40) synthase TruA [Candidatus Saganbacteria bacterium]|nr:tRNA pseudouridine(38-40) synthase TruA [Candidatus Saganbacteria bacterium]
MSISHGERDWLLDNQVRKPRRSVAGFQHTVKLSLAFDGAGFAGYELQPGKRTVRNELAAALKTLYGRPIKFSSSSRTDAGVHAVGLVVSYRPPFEIPAGKLPLALNALLPEDLRVVGARVIGARSARLTTKTLRPYDPKTLFNARFDAKSKTYEYLIFNGRIMPPAIRDFAWQVKPQLDLAAMKKAARCLVGKHDFSSFCASGGDDRDHVRIIHKFVIRHSSFVIWSGKKTDVIRIRVAGNGFLYKMVRNIVGTLVEVGLGRVKPEEVKAILAARDRRRAGKTAPAHGLCLVKVTY